MNKLDKRIALLAALLVAGASAHAAQVRFFYDDYGNEVEVCHDRDGWVVYYSSGNHAYGTGYSLGEVKRSEGLRNESRPGFSTTTDCA